MKNCFFGDIHDYLKYALLRQVADVDGTSTAVCWMLTEDDGETGGRHTKYLRQPEKWSSFDPLVFDFLQRQVLERETRDIRTIERSNILPNCRFYSHMLTDDYARRKRYFNGFMGFARGAAFVFFDPDNGVEVKSVGYGKKRSSKYLYRSEIEMALHAKHSLLIYQHLPLQPRIPFIARMASMLLQAGGCGSVYSIRTGQVAFFLVPQRDTRLHFHKTASAMQESWGGFVTVSEHRRKATGRSS